MSNINNPYQGQPPRSYGPHTAGDPLSPDYGAPTSSPSAYDWFTDPYMDNPVAPETKPQSRLHTAAHEVGTRIMRLFRRNHNKQDQQNVSDSHYDYTYTDSGFSWDYPQESSTLTQYDRGTIHDHYTPSPPRANIPPKFSRRQKLFAGLAAFGVTASGVGVVLHQTNRGEDKPTSTSISAEEEPNASAKERVVIDKGILEKYKKAFQRSDCGGKDRNVLSRSAAESYANMFGDTLPTADQEQMAALASNAAQELEQAESALSWNRLSPEQLTTYNRLRDDIINNKKPTIPFTEYESLLNGFLKEFKIKAVFDWKPGGKNDQLEKPPKSEITPMTEAQLEKSANARAVVLGVIEAYANTPVDQSKKLGIKHLYVGNMFPDTLGAVYVQQSQLFGFVSTKSGNYIMVNAGNNMNPLPNPVNRIAQTGKTIYHEGEGHVYAADSVAPICMLWETPGYEKAVIPYLNPKHFRYGMAFPKTIETATTPEDIMDATSTTEYGNSSEAEDLAELVAGALGAYPNKDLFGDSSARPEVIDRKLGLWASTLDGSVRVWVEVRIRAARIGAAMNEAVNNIPDPSQLPPEFAVALDELNKSLAPELS